MAVAAVYAEPVRMALMAELDGLRNGLPAALVESSSIDDDGESRDGTNHGRDEYHGSGKNGVGGSSKNLVHCRVRSTLPVPILRHGVTGR